MIPSTVKESLREYILSGRPTGGFLHAVLSNDLMEAMGRADEINRARLFDICSYIYEKLPSISYGSPASVSQWLKLHENQAPEIQAVHEQYKDKL